MKFEFTKDWCIQMARLEDDAAIGAGQFAFDPIPDLGVEAEHYISEQQPSIVFGRFVNLMRRKRKLSLERLAKYIDIDISELVEIEEDTRHRPEPRTVYLLANHFNVPRNKLMQIAGLTIPKDAHLLEEGFRFAARSDPLVELSKEESAALDAFISVLSEQK